MRAQNPPKLSRSDIPSVVVLIPGAESVQPPQRSSFKSPTKLHKSQSTSSPPCIPLWVPKLSVSAPSSAFGSLSAATSASSSSSSRRSLFPSSLSSTLASSSLLRNHSSASSSSSYSLASSSSSGHRSRSSRHDHPIDIANPFGDDPYHSFKRVAPSGQDAYVCRWRLRDKKGVLDLDSHQYCNSRLMTPDLLARHVLTQHAAPDLFPDTYSPSHKTACKWNSCFDRHYDAAGLASHLVHDHFTHQMGLKFACVATRCPVKTFLTSYDALHRHHTQYHVATPLPDQLRKVWRPLQPRKDPDKVAKLLAALRHLDAAAPSWPKILVSASANRKFAPAILRATEYDQQDLDRIATPCVELDGDLLLRAIEEGTQNGQLYRTRGSIKASTAFGLVPPPLGYCQVVLPQSGSQNLEESIAPSSLGSVQREMKFDADLSKQRRWADSVLDTHTASSSRDGASKSVSAHESTSGVDSDEEEASDHWAPPLWPTPYHPSSRCRIAIDSDNSSDNKLPVIQRQMCAQSQALPTSGQTSLTTSRSTSPKVQPRSSTLTPVSRLGSTSATAAPTRLKREREHDHTTLLNAFHFGREPLSPRIKVEEAAVPFIDLTASDDGRGTSLPAKHEAHTPSLGAIWVEAGSQSRAGSSPTFDRLGEGAGLKRANETDARGQPTTVS